MATAQKHPRIGKPARLRVIGINEGGKFKNKKLSDFSPSERQYFVDLHKFIDRIYTAAASEYEWTWGQLAGKAGLAYATVANLGDRQTKYPRYSTVYRLAKAIGWNLALEETIRTKAKGKRRVAG